MQKIDATVTHSSGEQLVRACPNNSLKAPVRKFEETFSIEKSLLEKFSKKN